MWTMGSVQGWAAMTGTAEQTAPSALSASQQGAADTRQSSVSGWLSETSSHL